MQAGPTPPPAPRSPRSPALALPAPRVTHAPLAPACLRRGRPWPPWLAFFLAALGCAACAARAAWGMGVRAGADDAGLALPSRSWARRRPAGPAGLGAANGRPARPHVVASATRGRVGGAARVEGRDLASGTRTPRGP